MNEINFPDLILKIRNKESFEYSFKYANKMRIMMLNSIISQLLSYTDRIYLLNSLVTLIREIIVNAQKANAKRIFFRINNLDIKNTNDYSKGMSLFKEKVIGEFDLYEEQIEKSDYYIKLFFKFKEDDLTISVINNSSITPEELSRINLRIQKAMTYNNFSDAYNEIEDDTEGAGLGIVLTILFLKNMGIDPNYFKIQSNNILTETSLLIPRELRPSLIISNLKDKIISDVKGIPTFPQHVIELQKLCSDPDSTIEGISKKIMMDPALSSDVIKLSNSAGFVPGKRIETVNTAVMTIGLKNVNAILTTINARKILSDRYSKFEQIWDHCNKVAMYARQISINLKLHKMADFSFLAGLLHDLGKIILLSTDKKLVMNIDDETKERKIRTSTIMEEISIGISHSSIGYLIAQKWNFPEYLIEAIKHHHSPLNAGEKYKDVIYIVYLANMICGIEEKKYYFYYLDNTVLERYDIIKEKDFVLFHSTLKKKFEIVK